MNFQKLISFIVDVLYKMPPTWVCVLFLVLSILIVVAIKRIFF